ncbi:Hexokinase-3 [Glycine soja]|nr:Hexokinase-3 [Glycine soja]
MQDIIMQKKGERETTKREKRARVKVVINLKICHKRSRRKWKKVANVVRELEEGCATRVGRLRQVVDAMAVEMHAGLASEGGSKLKMLLTFVDNLPNGTERGTYYALHLGGTNFRVLRVQLNGQPSSDFEHEVERQPIPQHVMTSTSEDLFDFIASSLKEFIAKEGDGSNISQDRRELGFTFSFPVKQMSVSSGILIKWTKGFSIGNMVGRDVATCLQEALARKGLDVRVAALVRKYFHLPTVMTPLMSAMHEDNSPDLREVARILNDIFEIPDVPLKARKIVVKVCDVVTRRAARLAAAGIVGILKKIGRDGSGGITGGRSRSDMKMRRTVVAIEGGLYSKYALFREYLREALNEILGEDIAKHVILKVTEDGSGIGAALLAASYSS